MKKICTLFLCLIVSGFAFSQDKLKIASLNINSVINLSKEGKNSQELLSAQKKQSDSYLKIKVEELKKKQEELKNSVMLTEKAKQERLVELQKMYVALKREEAKAAQDIRENEKRYAETLFSRIKPVIEAIAKREKYDLVLDDSLVKGMFYHNLQIVDITNQVISEFNNLPSGN